MLVLHYFSRDRTGERGMKSSKARYQQSSISKLPRASGGFLWKVRFSEHRNDKRPQRTLTFDGIQYPTERDVRAALETTVVRVSTGTDRYRVESLFRVRKSELCEIDHDFSARGNGLAFFSGGKKSVLLDSGHGFLVQSKAEAASNPNLFGQSVFTHQHCDDGHLHKWMSCKRIGEVRVNHVDRDGSCIRQRIAMLVHEMRFIR